MLAKRLTQRGVTVSGGALAAVLAEKMASACLPPMLAVSTVKAVSRVAAGEAAAAALSAEIAVLAEGVVKSMFLTKLNWPGAFILMLTLLGTGVGGFAYLGRAAQQAPLPAPVSAAKSAKPIPPPPQAPAQVSRLLRDALGAARTIEDKQWKPWMLMIIAAEQAKAGDKVAAAGTFREALAAAKDVDKPADFAKYHTTMEIAGQMARAGDIGGARKIAEALEHEDWRDSVLMEVAAAQARARDVQGALKTAGTIGTKRHKGAALRVVVEVHAEAGRLKEASRLAETIAGEFDRALAIVAIARARAKAKDLAAARKDLAEALKIADGIEEGNRKVFNEGGAVTYANVAKAQAELGDVEAALKTANAIKNEARKDYALGDVAEAQIEAGDLRGALKTAESISDEYPKGKAMKAMVAARLRASDPNGATKTAESIASVAWRVESLLEIAKFQAKGGDRASADKTFQKAYQEAENVRDEEAGIGNIRNAILSQIVKAQAEAGEEKKALAWTAKQTSPLLKTQALLGIAQGLAPLKEAQQGSRE
jgi:tetratricopeptide (TPR) repeat protein